MNDDIILELYYGEFKGMAEDVPSTEEQKELNKKCHELEQEVLKILKQYDKNSALKLLDNLFITWLNAQEYESILAFKQGIKLGLTIK